MNRRQAAATQPPVPSSEQAGASGASTVERGGTWLSAGLVLVAGAVLVTVLLLAAVHVDDRYLLDHVSGTRMALAKYYNDGTLYPELFQGRRYGGTRWMPLPIVVHGLVSTVTGDYLVSGRLISYAAMAGVLVAMVWLMRKVGTPGPLALGLVAVVLATRTGLSSTFDLRFDAFPLLLQLLAVGIVARSLRPRVLVGAAGLAALALVSKLTAVWAALAIVVWLFLRDRRRLVWFIPAYVAIAGAFLLLFVALTEGRMVENVFGLSASGVGGLRSFLVAPYRLIHLLVSHATAAWALVPMVAFAAWVALQQRQASIYVISLLLALAILLVVLTDVGTGWNQLIDVIVLAPVVLGEAAGRMRMGTMAPAARRGVRAGTVLTLSVLWVGASGLAVTLVPAARQAAANPQAYPRAPLAGLATSETSILSEDPYVPLSLGQTPVVLDPFMLLRLGGRDPEAVTTLTERLERQEFDLVVLVVPLEPLDQEWWREYHFGQEIVQAIDGSYRFSSRAHEYYIYVPRRGDG